MDFEAFVRAGADRLLDGPEERLEPLADRDAVEERDAVDVGLLDVETVPREG